MGSTCGKSAITAAFAAVIAQTRVTLSPALADVIQASTRIGWVIEWDSVRMRGGFAWPPNCKAA